MFVLQGLNLSNATCGMGEPCSGILDSLVYLDAGTSGT